MNKVNCIEMGRNCYYCRVAHMYCEPPGINELWGRKCMKYAGTSSSLLECDVCIELNVNCDHEPLVACNFRYYPYNVKAMQERLQLL